MLIWYNFQYIYLRLFLKLINTILSYFNSRPLVSLFLFLSPVLLWSIISPKNIFLWFGESLPVFIGIIAMLKTHKTFPLTSFSYIVIFIGSSLILIGAHYSYSLVPLFDWIKSYFGFERNNYDKLGHFFQGFIAVIIVREYFLRQKLINSKKWIDVLAFAFAICLSAIWEILEWFAVSILIFFGSKKPASEFLGAQNFFWDAQSDMFFALIGGLTAIFIFGKYHKRKIQELPSSTNNIIDNRKQKTN